MQSTSRRRMVIYLRISDDREGRQNGVVRQEGQCRKLADGNGDEVVAIFKDNDMGAWAGKRRPDYARMVAYLKAGHADGAYALAPTRFYRRLYDPRIREDALEFLQLVDELNLTVETVKQGRYDLSTADGRRDAKRAALDAEYEADLIGERVRDAKQDNLRAGTYRGGPRPFAFESDGVTVRSLECPACGATGDFTMDRECRGCGGQAVNVKGSEAWWVERAMDHIIAGGSKRSMCAELRVHGIQAPARRYRQPDGTRSAPRSRDFDNQSLTRTLLRARNAGLIEAAGEVVGRAVWPGVTTETKWRECKTVLEDVQSASSSWAAPTRWLGTGLYVCGVCGAPCAASSGAYRCTYKSCVSRAGLAVDKYVVAVILERLIRPDARLLYCPPETTPGDERRDKLGLAKALRGKLSENQADYDADLKTHQQFLESNSRLRERLATVEAEIKARAGVSPLETAPIGSAEFAETWKGYDLERKRAILDTVATVTILPAKRGRPKGYKTGSGVPFFDEATVRIEPKYPEPDEPPSAGS
ncbi:recombinase family protein [Streptomyces sp. NPDC088789]|uniref:recombinase family protein n=1 Tax=Streptomyces sp. NPDC088789 TaxID=3365899 RepID=UPI00380C79E4